MSPIDLIVNLLNFYSIIILFRVLADWVPNSRRYQAVQILIIITEPLLGKLRSVLPKPGNLDFSPIAAIFSIEILITIIKSI